MASHWAVWQVGGQAGSEPEGHQDCLGVLGFQPWGGIVGRMEGLLQADRAGCCLRPTSWSQELPPPPQPDTSASIQGAFAHLESQALKMSRPASFGRVLPGPVRHKLSTAFSLLRGQLLHPQLPLCVARLLRRVLLI